MDVLVQIPYAPLTVKLLHYLARLSINWFYKLLNFKVTMKPSLKLFHGCHITVYYYFFLMDGESVSIATKRRLSVSEFCEKKVSNKQGHLEMSPKHLTRNLRVQHFIIIWWIKLENSHLNEYFTESLLTKSQQLPFFEMRAKLI